jgi:hypothetical protein
MTSRFLYQPKDNRGQNSNLKIKENIGRQKYPCMI